MVSGSNFYIDIFYYLKETTKKYQYRSGLSSLNYSGVVVQTVYFFVLCSLLFSSRGRTGQVGFYELCGDIL